MNTLYTHLLLFFGSTLFAWSNTLEFQAIENEVSVPANQTKVKVEYPFTNNSEKELAIRRFDAPCACLTAEATGGTKNTKGWMVYKSGESGTIIGHLDLGKFKGKVVKKILVWTDGDKESSPSIRLSMSIKVPHQIAAYPSSLSWKKGAEAEPKEFTIKVTDKEPIKLLSHTSSNPAMTYKLETISPGFEYKVTVTPKSTVTPLFASLRFTTDSKNPRSKRVTAFLSVKP